jgi:precorrin-6Y C5,15-methyltransferase (decarboxylating)
VTEAALPQSAELAALGDTPGLPDEVFDHDGLITKRHQRASAFAFLRPTAGQLLWDVGSGSGAMAIEWCRAAPGTRAIGLERDPERAARARRNAERMTPGQVEINVGEAAGNIAGLPAPDAIFIGGGVTDGLLDGCWEALGRGGRIVAHGVTLETEALLADWFRAHGGSLTRLMIESAQPLGRFTAWVPARPVTQWACSKK